MRFVIAVWIGFVSLAAGQQQQPPPNQPPGSAGGVLSFDLQGALDRARTYSQQYVAAGLASALAHEDRVQAKAALFPTLNALNQYIYTQGNGTPSGVFVANDGVHIYNEQAVVHQELLSLVRRGELDRALAAEAIARAKVDVAVRGLNLTVIQNYYAIVVAQRKYTNTQASVQEAERFFDITQKLERGGE